MTTLAFACWTSFLKSTPYQVSGNKSCESGHEKFLKFSCDLMMLLMWSKCNVALRVEACHSNSLPYLAQCPWVFCKGRYNRFNLWCHLTKPTHWGVMGICGWELLAVCHHNDKLGNHRHCENGYMFLICHLTSHGHMFKVLCFFVGGNFS